MLRSTIASAAILAFVIFTSVCFACETSQFLINGNFDSRSQVHGDLPLANASFAEQTAAAQATITGSVFDSLGQDHTVTVLCYKTTENGWICRFLVDAGQLGGVSGQPFLLADLGYGFGGDGNIISASGTRAELAWTNGARRQYVYLGADFLLTHISSSTSLASSQDGSSRGCTQYGTMDFDGDGADDLAIYRPQTGMWAILKSSVSNADLIWKQWGLPGDYPMPGDYDHDGKADLVVWRPSNGVWYLCRSVDDFDCSQGWRWQFGLPGDRPIKGDFDGDRLLDYAIYRPSLNMYFYYSGRTGQVVMQQWGLPGDIPLLAGSKR